MAETSGAGEFGVADSFGDAAGDWHANGTAAGGNEWENKTEETPAFGGGAPVAAAGGW